MSLVRPGLSPPKHRWCCPAFPCCCRCAAAAHSLLNNYLKWLCHLNRKEEYSNCFCIRKKINTFLLFRRFFSHLEAFEQVLISTDTPAQMNKNKLAVLLPVCVCQVMTSPFTSLKHTQQVSPLPGLIKAGSSVSILFVAMITLTSPRESNPSSWFSSSNIVRWISLSPPEFESYL